MSLLDSVLGALTGGGAQPQNQNQAGGLGGLGGALGGISPALITAVIGMLANSQSHGSTGTGTGGGGLGDLLSKFQNSGLGGIASSWIQPGENQPITPDQVGSALGTSTTTEMANNLGMDHGDLLGQLAQVLPGIVDRLTPQGQVPQGGLGGVGDILAQLTRR